MRNALQCCCSKGEATAVTKQRETTFLRKFRESCPEQARRSDGADRLATETVSAIQLPHLKHRMLGCRAHPFLYRRVSVTQPQSHIVLSLESPQRLEASRRFL
ncbi:hypothetical protein BYI23_E003700 (plasmid) [Burkholderia sp. YI23]|nr:hypothetical protein BYI23_E003700 [Burkholderia sp. YI23]